MLLCLLVPSLFMQAQVDLVLSPAATTINVGDNLTLVLAVEAGTNEVDGIEVYLDYDPNAVTINSAVYNASAELPVPVKSLEVDPNGEINIATGIFGGDFATGTFDYLTIELTAIAPGATSIDFAFDPGPPNRTTFVTRFGDVSLGNTTGATINIVGVNTAPTVSITSPTGGTVYSPGDDVLITADASDSDGTVTGVEFFDGATSLGVDNTAPYTVTLANISAGSHSLTAVATDDDNATTTSATVTVTAQVVASQPVVSIGGPANKVVAEGSTLQIPISVSDADGDNLTVTVTSVSEEPQLLQTGNGGTQVDPFPTTADGFLTVSSPVNNPGAYSADLDFTPTFGDGGGANGDGDGVYTVTVEVSDGTTTTTTPFTVTVTDTPQSLSVSATTRIEAESFDNQGPAFMTGTNNGIGVEVNTGAATNIGFTHTGDFVEYLIDVPQAGVYDFSFEVAKDVGNAATMDIKVGSGGPVLGSIVVTPTGDWQDYVTVTASADLPAGPQTLRFEWVAGSSFLFNIDHFDVTANFNVAPVFANNIGDQTNNEGDVVSLDASASDPNGDAVTYTATNLPAGLSIDASTGSVTGTITAGQSNSSPFAVIITATDDASPTSLSEQISFNWTVIGNTNDAPSIAVSEVVADFGEALSIPITVTDEGTVALDVILYDKSGGGTNNPFTPSTVIADSEYTLVDDGGGSYSLNWTPALARSYYAVVTADDGVNATVSESFSIGIAQDLLTPGPGILARTFHNPLPWYGGAPSGGFTVAIETTPALNIGWIDAGEFVEYIIDVPAAGTYDATFFAGKGNTGTFTVTLAEESGTGFSPIGSFGATPSGWQNYIAYDLQVTFSNPGVQTLRLDFSGQGGINIRDFSFSTQSDVIAPVITLLGLDPVTVEQGSPYSDAGATATDNVDGDLTASITVGGDVVDVNTVGAYTLTYNVSDAAGNAADEVTRVVNVTPPANTAPVVTIDSPVSGTTVDRGVNVILTGSVTDAEESDLADAIEWTSGDIQFSTDPNNGIGESITGQFVTPGSQTLTASVTDAGGLTDTDVVTVEVSDPTVTITAPVEGETLTTTDVQLQWTATNVLYDLTEHFHIFVNPPDVNNIDTDTRISTASQIGQLFWDLTAADGITIGANTIVLRPANQFHEEFISDPNDPLSYIQDVVNFSVAAPDVTAPVVTLLGDDPLNLTIGEAYTELGATATDDVDGDLTAGISIDASSVDVNVAGNYSVTYSVGDAAGNTGTAVRTVAVTEAVELPTPCENTLYRVNVGGPEVPSEDTTPLAWSQDQQTFASTNASNSPFLAAMSSGNSLYNGSGGGAHGGPIIMTDPSVPTSAPASVFNTERYDVDSNPEMKWEFPVTPGSEVQVTLLFAELFGSINSAGQRVFDVEIEGTVLPAFDNIDPFAIAGPKGAFSRSATLIVTDGTLDIEFIHGVENPALKGIQICGISDPADVTPPVIALLGDNPLELTVGDTFTDPGATATDDVDGDITASIIVGGDAVDTNVEGSYVLTYNVADAAGNAATEVTRTVNVNEAPVLGEPSVLIEVTPGAGLGASTFGGSGNFQITNQSTGNLQVTGVIFDLSTGILPDMVFDPTGSGGDDTAQCFNPGATAADVGLVTPVDPCVEPFSAPRNGGFDVLSASFGDFDPGENFSFSVDIDPNSIQGVAGAGAAGSVSGYELIGATVTVSFNDGSILTGSLYEDGSLGGSQTVITADAPSAPTLSVVGLTSTPATVGNVNQTITVAGTPGDNVSLLLMDSRLFIASGDAPFNVGDETYYANEAMSGKTLYTGVIGSGGTVDIPVVLLQTPSGNASPDGGLNQLVAVTSDGPYAVDQATSNTSNVLTLLYDPSAALPDLTISVTRQGISDPSGDYTVKLYQVNAVTPDYDLVVTADAGGQLIIDDILPGTYEVAVKYANTLQVVDVVTVTGTGDTYDAGPLLTGDADDNNRITLVDFGILLSSLDLSAGDANYDARANFNSETQVNVLDLTFVLSNFRVIGEEPSGLTP